MPVKKDPSVVLVDEDSFDSDDSENSAAVDVKSGNDAIFVHVTYKYKINMPSEKKHLGYET